VQALAAALQLTVMVGGALLLVVLSVQLIRAAADRRPVPAVVPNRAGRPARPGCDDLPSSARLRTCLPARAPPPDRELPPAQQRRQLGSRLHRPCPARAVGDDPRR